MYGNGGKKVNVGEAGVSHISGGKPSQMILEIIDAMLASSKEVHA